MATPNIVPRADSEGGLGTASKYWASAYIDTIYVGGGKMGRDADNNLDFSTDNNIFFKINGSNEIVMDANRIYPAVNDGSILGHPSYQWSDLFLASGAVINFDNGNVTLTHSNNRLKINDSTELAFGDGQDLKIYHDTTDTYIDNSTGTLIIRNSLADADVSLQAKNTSNGIQEYLRLDGSIAKTTVHRPLKFNDGISSEYGTDTDMLVYHSGSNGAIENYNGNLTITNAVHGGDIFLKAENSSGTLHTYFQVDGGSEILQVHKDLYALDNVKLRAGNAGDLEIYHDSTDSYIKNSHGNLLFRNNKQNKDILFQGDDGQASDDTVATYFFLDGSSAAHDGSATTALYTNWPDNSRISLGTSHDLQIYHNGSNTLIQQMNNATGNLIIKQSVDGADILFQGDDGSGSIADYFRLDGSDVIMKAHKNIRYLQNVKATFGNTDDLKIYHDGVNSYIEDSGTGNLKIRTNSLNVLNAANSEVMLDAAENGAVTLYYDNAAKLATTSTGINVAGDTVIDDGVGRITLASVTNENRIQSTTTGFAAYEKLAFSADEYEFKIGNATFAGTVTASAGITQPIASAAANVASAVAGSIYNFSDADGATVTLPDSGSGTELGKTYEFVTTVTATSNAHKIVCADTANERIMGSVTMVDTDSSDAVRVFSSQYSAENSAISMNGSTTGGVAGTKIKITNVAADIWIAEAVILHTGDVATPFATS